MIKAFESKIDIHRYTGSMIQSLLEGKVVLPADVTDEFRQKGKKSNHGLNYMMGYKEFALHNQMSEGESEQIYKAYHAAYPGVAQGWDWQLEELRKTKTLESCWLKTKGVPEEWCLPRRRTFRAPLLLPDGKINRDLWKEAVSFRPQNTVAEGVNIRGILFCYYNQDKFKHVELLNQVHDSLVFQIPLSAGFDYHSFAVNSIKESLEQPIFWKETKFSIPVDIEIGLNLKNVIKFKNAVTEEQIKESYEKLKS
jgi:DNA polymerase I-like protein with 3'-5' exonuclease and polymerase domains